jgi:hypothetical protein
MGLLFVAGPLLIHSFFVNPLLRRISNFRDQVNMQAAGLSPVVDGPAPASDREVEQLEQVKVGELARLKKVDSRESLLQFSGALADALAFEAESCGLRVSGVDLDSPLIRAKYVPNNGLALKRLKALPGVGWDELKDPLQLPMLSLPSIEIQMTVAAEYSKVFSFVESLPDFPVPVALASLATVDDPLAKAFRLKIRGYYYALRQLPVEAAVYR